MLENRKVNGIHLTRYIESWRNIGGECNIGETFDEWLRSEGLTDEDLRDIHDICGCGKFELEQSARPFVEKQKKEIEELIKEIELEEKAEKKKKKFWLFR